MSADRFLTRALFGLIIDHPIADLFRRPTIIEMAHNALAQLRIPDQLALCRSTSLRALVRRHAEVSRVLLRKGIICPEIAYNLAENRRLVALQDVCHLGDRHLCILPVFNLATLLHAQLRINGSHAMFSSLDKPLFSNRSRTSR